MRVIDLETTGLAEPWAVQIAVTDRHGSVLLNEYVYPGEGVVIEDAAISVHGITSDRLASAPAFAEVLPALTQVCQGRTLVAYGMPYDRGCLE
ncbi:3'-5' exonuclease [Streptomyces sp. PA03-6a]|nr:3'-5' exonuclease [Streptomyces sp. PA03-6a]